MIDKEMSKLKAKRTKEVAIREDYYKLKKESIPGGGGENPPQN